MPVKRRLALLLAVLQLLAWSLPASAAEWDPTDPNDPLLWEPDLPEFDGPMPRTPCTGSGRRETSWTTPPSGSRSIFSSMSARFLRPMISPW